MINVRHLSNMELAGLYFQCELYWQGVFSEGEHENGFQVVTDLDSAIENKNLWVKDSNVTK